MVHAKNDLWFLQRDLSSSPFPELKETIYGVNMAGPMYENISFIPIISHNLSYFLTCEERRSICVVCIFLKYFMVFVRVFLA